MSSYGIIEIYTDHICINKGFVQVSPDLKCQFIYTLSIVALVPVTYDIFRSYSM